jgi:hypothetical protein
MALDGRTGFLTPAAILPGMQEEVMFSMALSEHLGLKPQTDTAPNSSWHQWASCMQ